MDILADNDFDTGKLIVQKAYALKESLILIQEMEKVLPDYVATYGASLDLSDISKFIALAPDLIGVLNQELATLDFSGYPLLFYATLLTLLKTPAYEDFISELGVIQKTLLNYAAGATDFVASIPDLIAALGRLQAPTEETPFF